MQNAWFVFSFNFHIYIILSVVEENEWQDQCSRHDSELFFRSSIIHQTYSKSLYLAPTVCQVLWAQGAQQQTKQVKPCPHQAHLLVEGVTSQQTNITTISIRCQMVSAIKKLRSIRAKRSSHGGSHIILCIGQMDRISEIYGAKARLGKINH